MSDNLPNDVLINIFTRLPVKSIIQCTSVCKSWHSTITHPAFIESHLNLQKLNDLFLVRSCPVDSENEVYSLHRDDENFTEYAKIDFPFEPAYNGHYRIVGSCNGVICLSDDLLAYVDEVILWNPTIKKWVKLPPFRVTYKTHGGFDHVIGFGFDSQSNDYKVVRLVYLSNGCRDPPEVDVYTLSTGIWRDISLSARNLSRMVTMVSPRAPQANVNGAVHWIGADMNARRNMIVSFDMESEVFRSIEFPTSVPFFFPNPFDAKLMPAVVEGSLALVGRSTKRCSIWLMKEYGVSSSWTKKRNIEFSWPMDRIIGFRREGGVLFEVKGGLYSSHPEDSEKEDQEIMETDPFLRLFIKAVIEVAHSLPEKLGFYSRTDGFACGLHAENYTESLVLLGRQTLSLDNEVKIEGEEGEANEEDDKRVLAGVKADDNSQQNQANEHGQSSSQ